MEKKLESVIRDHDFEMIGLSLMEPNIFRSLSIERMEIRHSNFIAYLLDPRESHGLGDVVIRKLLRDIFSDSKASTRDIFDADELDLRNIEIRREWRDIDILIILDHDIVVIENKVDAEDHTDQLKKYKEIAESAFPGKNIHYVYLTPYGNDPLDTEYGKIYINYSYEQMAEIIASILKLYGNRISQKIYFYLSDYLMTVKRKLLMNDKLNELAVKVYKAHKEAFDFIIENKPDPAAILNPFFLIAVRKAGFVEGSMNKGYVRFTTTKLKEKLPAIGQGWSNREIFLFEIEYCWNKSSAIFRACIAHSDDPIKETLHEMVKKSKHYKTPQGKKWLVFYSKSFPFIASEMINEDEKEIEKKVRDIFYEIQPVAEEISKLIEDQIPYLDLVLSNSKS